MISHTADCHQNDWDHCGKILFQNDGISSLVNRCRLYKPSSGAFSDRASNFENSGSATITVGMVMVNPYSRIVPRFASKIVVRIVGLGCSGRKQCVTDNAATIGTPTYSNGSTDEATIVKTSGNTNTNPISKNITRHTISPVISSAHCTRFVLNVLMIVVAMRCAVPVSVSGTNLPSIVPKSRIMANPPNIPPIPFYMECRTACAPIPLANPMTAATRTRAIKPLTLKPIVKTNSSATLATCCNGYQWYIRISYQRQNSSAYALRRIFQIRQQLVSRHRQTADAR